MGAEELYFDIEWLIRVLNKRHLLELRGVGSSTNRVSARSDWCAVMAFSLPAEIEIVPAAAVA
jgi:hypothetical protein